MEHKVMDVVDLILETTVKGVKSLYDQDISKDAVIHNATRKEFEGDYTVVVFPFTKAARKKPEQIGEELGQFMLEHCAGTVVRFNVVKGFLNLVVSDDYWKTYLGQISGQKDFGRQPATGKKVVVEFSSPNTNKPLHLGHIRNILLGWSCSKILEAVGNDVFKVQIVNDRGIAVCKSMLAWQKFGDGETPESSQTKGDFLVGKYYVLFDQKLRAEYGAWQKTEEAKALYESKKKDGQDELAFFKAYKNAYFNNHSQLGTEAKDLLLKWEANDPAVRQLWAMMNSWVYDGFDQTYDSLGVSFDKLYYESDTYLLGKEEIEKGLQREVFYLKEDGSTWIDLEAAKLDHKAVLRSDGTALYITQDIGTAQLRYDDFGMDQMVYVVGDEQNYHFQTLFEIMKRLGAPYADRMFHLSYGMVDLPDGKMKSREGTVVDADMLVAEVIEEARKRVVEGTSDVSNLPQEEQKEIFRQIGLAALKYFIVKVNPKKRMTFNPAESVELQGQTGPYIQYSYVRIAGVLDNARKAKIDLSIASQYAKLESIERDIIRLLYDYPSVVQQAAADLDPSLIANFCYDLAKAFNKSWHDFSILNAESDEARAFRLQLAQAIGHVLQQGMDLLGIEMPAKM
ncbi:MAG: arginine--tRNA ligase [Bacteroidota bacterium]